MHTETNDTPISKNWSLGLITLVMQRMVSMVHGTIWYNIANDRMLPRHKQAQDNVIQFLGSYLTIWCGWKPTAQAILPQWHMHPQHLHIGLICQAIPLEFHCCYWLIWYISLSTEHSSATQDSPPTLSSYGRKSNSSLPIQCLSLIHIWRCRRRG